MLCFGLKFFSVRHLLIFLPSLWLQGRPSQFPEAMAEVALALSRDSLHIPLCL